MTPDIEALAEGVPDDTLIDTVAWTAGQHRAARVALNGEPSNGNV